MINVKPGDLRQVIDIEQPSESRSASGAVSNPPWTLFATWRCKMVSVSGSEDLVASEFITERTHKILGRYVPGVTAKMRLNFRTQAQRNAGVPEGRLFDILFVNDVDELHIEMDLDAKEKVRGKGL